MKVQVGEPPFHFAASNFNQLKTMDTCWYSPPTYTHIYGYKFCINVWPNGVHNSMGIIILMCQYCSTQCRESLMPPSSGQQSSASPYSSSISTETETTSQRQNSFSGRKKREESLQVILYTAKLIAHTDLDLNAQKQTQYLKDDVLSPFLCHQNGREQMTVLNELLIHCPSCCHSDYSSPL